MILRVFQFNLRKQKSSLIFSSFFPSYIFYRYNLLWKMLLLSKKKIYVHNPVCSRILSEKFSFSWEKRKISKGSFAILCLLRLTRKISFPLKRELTYSEKIYLKRMENIYLVNPNNTLFLYINIHIFTLKDLFNEKIYRLPWNYRFLRKQLIIPSLTEMFSRFRFHFLNKLSSTHHLLTCISRLSFIYWIRSNECIWIQVDNIPI